MSDLYLQNRRGTCRIDFKGIIRIRGDAVMRKRLFEIIETAQENDWISNVYDVFMMIMIIVISISANTTVNS